VKLCNRRYSSVRCTVNVLEGHVANSCVVVSFHQAHSWIIDDHHCSKNNCVLTTGMGWKSGGESVYSSLSFGKTYWKVYCIC
jgi:hypothetical protein